MVTNEEVVAALEEIASLLEIKGENAFKVRAYRMAAAQADNLGTPLTQIAATEGGLQQLDGFGPAIAEKVQQLLDTGHIAQLESLRQEIPPSLIQVRELPGIGPRTAAMLWQSLGITNLDELSAAVERGALLGLPRLGAKSTEKIAHSVSQHQTRGAAARRPRQAVAPIADLLVNELRAFPQAEKVEVAGSFRRGSETSGDLDIVVSTQHGPEVLRAFARLPQVETVLLCGDTKCSVEVAGAFQVDCRAIEPESFGAAMQYFTGSQSHNVKLRGRALRLGMMLNEYGLYRLNDDTKVGGETEEDVYSALGLRWIPPQDRIGRDEIDAAALAEQKV
jgi:DNA polymerase (family 10)